MIKHVSEKSKKAYILKLKRRREYLLRAQSSIARMLVLGLGY
jgi:hypothetical protein